MMLRMFLQYIAEMGQSIDAAREQFALLADALAAGLATARHSPFAVEKKDEGFYLRCADREWFFRPTWEFAASRFVVSIYSVDRLPDCTPQFTKLEGPEWSVDPRGNFYTSDRVHSVSDQDDVTMAVLRRLNLIPEKPPGW